MTGACVVGWARSPFGRLDDPVIEGWTAKDGRLPANPCVGLKAKSHPIGATGVSMHVPAPVQLTGQAPPGMPLPAADSGGVFNMGGAAVANCVSILEPLHCRPRRAARTMRTCRLEAADFPASACRSRSWTRPGSIWRRASREKPEPPQSGYGKVTKREARRLLQEES